MRNVAMWLLLLVPSLGFGQEQTCIPCLQFDSLNTAIRDNRISKPAAATAFIRTLSEVAAYYKSHQPESPGVPHFPLKGYGPKAIGDGGKDWYITKGYDYFDGNRHKAHPALDIFIRDRNQDQLEDPSNKPVQVVSVTDGIVVAAAQSWDSTSLLRGGVYLYVYAPKENRLYYYAHNQVLLVSVGELVRAGQPLATVGRSGLNAFKKRSPTHLHLMVLAITPKGIPKPVNVHAELDRALRTN